MLGNLPTSADSLSCFNTKTIVTLLLFYIVKFSVFRSNLL